MATQSKEKHKTLTGYTTREPAPESYMIAIGTALERKAIMNGNGYLLRGRKRMLSEYQRAMYEAHRKRLQKAAKRRQTSKNTAKPFEPSKAKLSRYTKPSPKAIAEQPKPEATAELTVS